MIPKAWESADFAWATETRNETDFDTIIAVTEPNLARTRIRPHHAKAFDGLLTQEIDAVIDPANRAVTATRFALLASLALTPLVTRLFD